ncbi:MAG: hypothetical protein QM503_10140 [Bacteroidota bacterium]
MRLRATLPEGGCNPTGRYIGYAWLPDQQAALTIRFVDVYDVLPKEALREYRENRVKTTVGAAYFGDRLDFYQPWT